MSDVLPSSANHQEASPQAVYVAPGMPELDMQGKTTSFFEFWPMWLMYLPVVVQWLLLSIRYRSLTLPLLANASIPLSGMVGVPKSAILEQASDEANKSILHWFLHQVTSQSASEQAQQIIDSLPSHDMSFPIVAKPDIGCRGSGVKLMHNAEELAEYIASYPASANIMLQKLAQHEPEAGVFFVRKPGSKQGEIISLGLKYSPYVVGDGKSSLAELLARDPRAGELQELYASRHRDQLKQVIEKDQPYRLVFSVSHCRGAIFRNGNAYITHELTQSLNRILAGIPDFNYGRLDIKFPSIEKLAMGEGIEIIEINTASSEPLHIWDRNATLREAISALLFQYHMLFKIGASNRAKGFKPPGLRALVKAFLHEKKLVSFHPEND